MSTAQSHTNTNMLINKVSSLCSWRWDASNHGENLLRAVLAIAAVTILTVLFWFSWFAKKPKQATIAPLPPGPRGLPLAGYLPFLGVHLHKKFTELAAVYGPIYKLWLGQKLCMVISSASLAKELGRDNDVIFSSRDPPISSLIVTYGGKDIAWSSYGSEWKKKRKVFVSEMLSKANLDASYELRKEEVKKAVRHAYNKIGNLVDVGELAGKTVMNAVIRLLIGGGKLQGEKWANIFAEFRELTAELMVLLATPNVSEFFPVLARFDLQGIEKDSRRLHERFDRIINSVIDQRSGLVAVEAKKEEKTKDFLQILLDLCKNQGTKTSITMDELKAMLVDIMVGGTDTTTTMIEWTMSELMQHQEVMENVCQELEKVVGLHNIVEEFHLPQLEYLGAVIKETFRLHPALPLLVPRCAGQSCTVGGYAVPKGTTVFLNAYAIHRDPNLWENPLEYKPERFLNGESNKYDYLGNSYQYFPFGSGRKICAGLPLGEKMLMYLLASLLHSFEWKLPDGTKLELSEKFGLVMKKMKPLTLIPTPRLSNLELY